MKFTALDISAMGLRAQRIRMETIANNIANIETTDAKRISQKTEKGDFIKHLPFRRKNVVFQSGDSSSDDPQFGILVPRIVEDMSDFIVEHKPEHPHSVKNPDAPDFGKVYFPNVNQIVEQVDMGIASRAYEANAAAIEFTKSMNSTTMRLFG